jgi:hypothetical protein
MAAWLGIIALLTQVAAALIPMPVAGAFGLSGPSSAAAPCMRDGDAAAGHASPASRDDPSPGRTSQACPICVILHSAGTFLPPGPVEPALDVADLEFATPAAVFAVPVGRLVSPAQPRAPPLSA